MRKLRGLRLVVAAVAVGGLTLLAPVNDASADPDVANCEVIGFVVKTPTHIVEASSGDGFFGTVSTPAGTFDSQIVCEGAITGSSRIEGNFEWCPNTHGGTHANPVMCTDGTKTGWVTHDQALWPGALPTSVHVNGEAETIDSSMTVVHPGGVEVGVNCTFRFSGHAFVPGTRLDVKDFQCGAHASLIGSAEAEFVPIVGNAAGDAFHGNNPKTGQEPESCADWAQGPEDQDCFRGVIFAGDMTVGTDVVH